MYYITPAGPGTAAVHAYCDMSNGGWTAFFDAGTLGLTLTYAQQFGLTAVGEGLSSSLTFHSGYAVFGASSGGGWPTYAQMRVASLPPYTEVRASFSFWDSSNHLCTWDMSALSTGETLFSFGDCWAGADCTHASYRTAASSDMQSLCTYTSSTCNGNTYAVSMSLAAEAVGLQLNGGKYSGYAPNFPRIHNLWVK